MPISTNLQNAIPLDYNEIRSADVALFTTENDWYWRRYSQAFLRYRVYATPGPEWKYFLPKYQRNSQEYTDYAAFKLRDHYSLTYAKIARIVGFAGESSARMAVNRYRHRNLGSTRGYAYQLGTGGRRQIAMAVTVDSRKFGVELEFKELGFYYAAQVVEGVTGRHCHNTDYHGRVCHTCRQRVGYGEWKIEKDGTVCRTDSDGEVTGGEAIAPVGSGDSHLDEISRVMTALRGHGAIVDRDAGMHVHLNMKDLTGQQLGQFVLMFQKQQDFLYGLVAPSRKNNSYCDHLTERDAVSIAEQFTAGRNSAYGPRAALNVSPYPRLGTFEVRLHQGTLNPKKMDGWVRLMLSLVQAVKDNKHSQVLPNLSVLGVLVSEGLLPQTVGSYLFARHNHFATAGGED